MNKIITITRQFGSGGREIGRKLAEAYGISFLRIKNMEQAEEGIDRFLELEGCVLMECLIDPMELTK